MHAALISLAAFGVYLWLAPSGLWLDEAISTRIAALPVGTFVRFVTHGEPNMVLFHAALAPVAHQHPSDLVLRVLPGLFGALALGTTYLLGSRIVGRGAALVATAVLGASGLTSAYAGQVRGYSLLLFLTVLSSLLLVQAVRADRTSPWVAFTVVAVLSLGAQQVAAFTIAAQFLSLLVLGRALPWRRAVLSGAALVVTFGTWRAITRSAPQAAGVSWIPPLSTGQVLDTLRSLSGGTNLTLLVVGLLTVAGVVLAVGHARRAGGVVEAWPDMLLVSTAVVPITLGLVFSLSQPLFLPRYYLAALPPIALLMGRAVTAMPRRPTGPILAGTFAVFLVLVANPTIDPRARDGAPAAVHQLLDSARPGDAVFLPYNEELATLQWYGHGRLTDALIDPRPGVPADAIATAWWWDDPVRMTTDLASAAQLGPDAWRASLADKDRIWVMRGFLAEDPRYHDTGSDVVPVGRQVCERHDYGGVTLELYARSCS